VFVRLGAFAVRRRFVVLVASGLFVLISAGVGVSVFSRLSPSGFVDPGSESARAGRFLEAQFHTDTPNLLLLINARSEPARPGVPAAPAVDAPSVVAAADQLTRELAARHDVRQVFSYWSLGKAPPLRSANGRTAIVAVLTTGNVGDAEPAQAKTIADSAVGNRGPITVTAAGAGPVYFAVTSTIKHDLARAELIAVPLTALFLVLVFGGVVAAGLPLVVGAMSVSGTFFILFVLTALTNVSVFSINLVTAMGLGLAIDYSLFVVSRFREELAAGLDPDEAVVRTVVTAGRTVAVSGLTVAVSLSALLVFPLYLLRSFAFAGIGVTAVSVAASVVTLPALLSVTGRRVDSLNLTRGRVRPLEAGHRIEEGLWHRSAMFVMRRPVLIGVTIVLLLVVLALPFLRINFGLPDERVLPASNSARVQTSRLTSEFTSNEAAAFPVIAPRLRGGDDAITTTAEELSSLPHVGRVDAVTGRFVNGVRVLAPDPSLSSYRSGQAVRFNVVPTVETISDDAERLVSTIRSTPLAVGSVIVGGRSASLLDTKAAIDHRLVWAIAIVVIATFVLLFLIFESVVIPLKAIVLNMLSLTATFGAMVWVFQEGHLSHLLDFTATGLTDISAPILMFCIAFGLSMDYEVFLLSRIKEEYDRTGDNVASVAAGLEKVGRIVTAAALLLAITFIATATSQVTFIKLFGVGLALAVLMDATLVRAGLVPALMKIMGDANWWAPRWLIRIRRGLWTVRTTGENESTPGHLPTARASSDEGVVTVRD
jgi:RND superfamily putative drug exporter